MKMAAGRRGWKPRQALSQASTRSHWLARARHRGQSFLPRYFEPSAQRKKLVLSLHSPFDLMANWASGWGTTSHIFSYYIRWFNGLPKYEMLRYRQRYRQF